MTYNFGPQGRQCFAILSNWGKLGWCQAFSCDHALLENPWVQSLNDARVNQQ